MLQNIRCPNSSIIYQKQYAITQWKTHYYEAHYNQKGATLSNLYHICIWMRRSFITLPEVSPTFIKTQKPVKTYYQTPLAKAHQSGSLTHFLEAVRQKGMLDLLLY